MQFNVTFPIITMINGWMMAKVFRSLVLQCERTQKTVAEKKKKQFWFAEKYMSQQIRQRRLTLLVLRLLRRDLQLIN